MCFFKFIFLVICLCLSLSVTMCICCHFDQISLAEEMLRLNGELNEKSKDLLACQSDILSLNDSVYSPHFK